MRASYCRMWLVAIAVITCAACGAASSNELAQRARAAVRPCTIEGLGAALCTTVRVRESDAGDRTIDLSVIVLPATSQSRRPDPIVPLSGGPGQGTAHLARAIADRFAAFRDHYDLVLIDQRGTGDSHGLWCPPKAATANLMGAMFDRADLIACRDRLSRAADLTQYTTTKAARDYEHVFDHLGYKTVNLVGISYGTRLGLEITRQMPARVRSLTLEAVAPPDFAWPSTGAADADAALNAVIDDCIADAECSRNFPRIRRDVDAAFERLRNRRVRVAVRDPATGSVEEVPFGHSDLAYATRGVLYGDNAAALPLWFRRAADGNYSAFAQAYVTRARTLDAQIARGVHFGVYCAEDLPFVDWPAAESAATGTRLGRYLIDEYRKGCEVWPRAPIDPAFRDPVTSDVPTLIMSGRRDPVTPPRTAESAMRTLSRAMLVTWPRGGHGNDGQRTPRCRTAIMRRFLETADPRAASTACVGDDPIPFATTSR